MLLGRPRQNGYGRRSTLADTDSAPPGFVHAMSKISETETVIKRIIPYLVRRGYDVDKDLTFEYPTAGTTRATLGFVDILVRRTLIFPRKSGRG